MVEGGDWRREGGREGGRGWRGEGGGRVVEGEGGEEKEGGRGNVTVFPCTCEVMFVTLFHPECSVVLGM